jgi:hypothetical protein
VEQQPTLFAQEPFDQKQAWAPLLKNCAGSYIDGAPTPLQISEFGPKLHHIFDCAARYDSGHSRPNRSSRAHWARLGRGVKNCAFEMAAFQRGASETNRGQFRVLCWIPVDLNAIPGSG